jgi:hypothetical protein
MSSSLPLAVVAILGLSSIAWAADQSEHASRPAAPAQVGRQLAVTPPFATLDPSIWATPHAAATRKSGGNPNAAQPLSFIELHLGRATRFGANPGDAPHAFGEVGIDIDPRADVALVPSYRVVLGNDEADRSQTFGAQILRLGVRMRF